MTRMKEWGFPNKMLLFDIRTNSFTLQNTIIFVQFCYHSYVLNLCLRHLFVIRHSSVIFLTFLILHHSRMHSGVLHLFFSFFPVNYFISFCWILHSLHWLKAFIWSSLQLNDPSLDSTRQDKNESVKGTFVLSVTFSTYSCLVSKLSENIGKSVPSQRKWECLECLASSKGPWLHSRSVLEYRLWFEV